MLCTFKACLNSLNNPMHIFFVRCRIDLVDTTGPTLISLINVEVGINVEGCKKCKITKCGGGNNIRHLSNEINKRGGWISFSGGWNFSKLVSVDSSFIREMRVFGLGLWRF